MFTKTLLFCFCFVGVFAVIISLFPSGFFTYQETVDSDAGVSADVMESLTLANVTVYNTGGQDNMTFDYTSLTDSPSPPNYLISGTTDDFVEVWWGPELLPPYGSALELRHATRRVFPVVYYDFHRMTIYTQKHTRISPWITAAILEQEWSVVSNSSAFYGDCEHATMSIAFGIYNTTRDTTITDAWNNGEISYAISYETNWNASSISGVSLLGNLIGFQNPNLGIPGDFGAIMNSMVAIPIMVMVIIAIIIVIQSVIPFIKGINDSG